MINISSQKFYINIHRPTTLHKEACMPFLIRLLTIRQVLPKQKHRLHPQFTYRNSPNKYILQIDIAITFTK